MPYEYRKLSPEERTQTVEERKRCGFPPVKHGLVSDVYDWSWSSLFWYEEEKGKEWLRKQWVKYKLPVDFGEGWDL